LLIIWNNKNIVVKKASVFERRLFSAGVVKSGDLLSDTGKFFEGAKVSEANLSTMDYFKLMSIVDAIPNNWRLVFFNIILDTFHLNPSITLYIAKSQKANSSHCSKKKLKTKYPQFAVDWKKIYSLDFVVTIETKIREFQYKLLNDIVFTHEKLFRFKMIDSPLCSFCKKDVESLEHLLFHCSFAESFWR